MYFWFIHSKRMQPSETKSRTGRKTVTVGNMTGTGKASRTGKSTGNGKTAAGKAQGRRKEYSLKKGTVRNDGSSAKGKYSRKGAGSNKRSYGWKKGRGKVKVRQVELGVLAALGAAAAILILIFSITHRWGHSDVETGARVPAGSWRYGIDISNNNEGRIVWDSLYVMTDAGRKTVRDPWKAKEITPVSFVFIKATEGEGFKDRSFDENWMEAGRSGLRRGAYHFFRSSKDGAVQAENFIRTVGKLRRQDLPPVLDIETMHRGCSKELLNQRALQWLKAVEKHYGRKPIVYTGSSFANDNLCREIKEGYPLWIAHYGKERPDYEGWTWWQVTDKAVVKGVPGKVDLNVMAAE